MTKSSIVMSVSLTLTAASAALAAPAAQGELLVRAAPGKDLAAALRRHGLGADGDPDRSGWVRVRGAVASGDVVGRLRQDASVAGAEPNFTVAATAVIDEVQRTWTPDDPLFARQWNLASAPSAWYTTRGDASVVVAVLDTGLTAGAEGPAFRLPGADLVNNDGDPADDNGHGTHIASIVAQATDNGAGAAGLAPDVTVLPVKVLDAAGLGTVATVANGIYFATDAGADVINLSLALSPAVAWSEPLHDAVAYAAAHGVVLVGAAGNDGVAPVALPAAFNEVIAVGALHSGGAPSLFSNQGQALDLVAPGGDSFDRDGDGQADGILAWSLDPLTQIQGLYLGAGTSQAAAHVSAAVALLVAAGESDRDRIRTLVELTAAPVGGGGWSPSAGYGRLDATAALAARATMATQPPSSLAGWVPGQGGSGGSGLELVHAVGLVLRLADETVLVLEDRRGPWALVDAGPDRIALHELAGSLVSLVSGRRGLGAAAGGGLALGEFLAERGAPVGTFESAGGVLGLLDATGSRVPGGALLALFDPARAVQGALGANGGVLGLLDASGGMLALLESAGGMLGLVEGAGGVLGFVDAAGGMLGLVEASGRTTPLGPANGLLRL